METAMSVLAGAGVLLSLVFLLVGSLLVIVPPAIALAAGAGEAWRMSWRTVRKETSPV